MTVNVIRVPIRVRPGAKTNRLGGSVGEPPRLVVLVTAKAVDGKATEAALAVMAEALGVPKRDVRLVSGATTRDKLVEIAGDVLQLQSALERLQGA